MNAWIVRDDTPGEWAVMLGLTTVVRHGSYQVAANIEYALNHGAPGTTECDEVARAILQRVGQLPTEKEA